MSALPPITDNEFRLLRIESVEPEIHIVVQSYPFIEDESDVQQKYCAVSYTWGDQSQKRLIMVNGISFGITPGLETLLIAFHNAGVFEESNGWAWIDQICIDQDDPSEKKVQVEAMRDIYSRSVHTYIWLGPFYQSCEDLFDKIIAIFSFVHELDIPTHQRRIDLMAANLCRDASATRALCNLFIHPWFARLWVVQEVITSPEVSGFFGVNTVPWDLLAISSEIMVAVTQTHRSASDGSQIIPGDIKSMAFRNAGRLNRLGQLRREQTLDFPDAFDTARLRLCHYPVDRLFAIRGILPREQRELISVNYESPQHEVWASCFKHILGAATDARWLWFIISQGSGPENSDNLPSWCPSLTPIAFEGPIFLFSRFSDLFVLDAREITVKILNQPENGIAVAGAKLDQISKISKPFEAPRDEPLSAEFLKELSEWEAQCYEFFESTSCADIEIYIRTLIRQNLASGSNLQARDFIEDGRELRADFEAFKSRLTLIAKEGYTNAFPYTSELPMFETLWLTIATNVASCRFFTTCGGLVGMGPLEAKEGDEVFSLDNCPYLWVLRKQDNLDAYTLVGTAYIYGHMFHGRDAPEEDTDRPRIVIV